MIIGFIFSISFGLNWICAPCFEVPDVNRSLNFPINSAWWLLSRAILFHSLLLRTKNTHRSNKTKWLLCRRGGEKRAATWTLQFHVHLWQLHCPKSLRIFILALGFQAQCPLKLPKNIDWQRAINLCLVCGRECSLQGHCDFIVWMFQTDISIQARFTKDKT